MLTFDRGKHVHTISLKCNADSNIVSRLSEEVLLSGDVGFAETAIDVDAGEEAKYRSGNAITGFASVGYFHESVEVRFPRLQTLAYIFGKRCFDAAFATVAIIFTSPLMLLIAIAIRLTSTGPVFFIQDRVGANGIFRMLKFRSMYLNDRSDTQHTSVADPRITSVGTLLRRSSLDELPQLFNVLIGEMSIVGPRPELVKFVERFKDEIPDYASRHLGKGGITGWAQVNGFRGSETSIATRIEYDLEYLKTWSFWLDLKIIMLTVYKGLVTNAY